MTLPEPIRSPSDPRLATASSSSNKSSVDIVVVGSGIVGSPLAFSLGRSGHKVALVERDFDEPDRIVGELLQPGGVRALALLGIQDTLEGIDAVPVEGYQVFYGPRSVPIPYPLEAEKDHGKGVSSKSGKVEGRSFHHGKFVQALRAKALAQSNVLPYEAIVRDVIQNAQGKVVGISATWKQGEAGAFEIRAPLTIIADGCFSKFRKTHGSTIVPMVRSNFVGLELEDAPLPAPHHGHVVLGPAGPVLLYQIGTHHTRILIDVQGERLPSVAKGELQLHIKDKVIPQLPEVLQECVLKELEKGQRLRSMPNSFLPPSMQGQNDSIKGVITVGDAMNMRHPLTGGGMSVGLWDVVHLTNSLGAGEWSPLPKSKVAASLRPDLNNWDSLKPALKAWHWNRKGLSSVINILAQALYSLFGADDANLEVLREGCFKYFELGGECVNGPVSLLSGLAPQPMLLVSHFFAVAIYSIYTLFAHPRQYPSESKTRKPSILEYPGLAWRSVMVFYTACIVILPVIFTEIRSNVPKFGKSSSLGDQTKLVVALLVALAAAALLTGHGKAAGLVNSTSSRAMNDWFFFPKAASANLISTTDLCCCSSGALQQV